MLPHPQAVRFCHRYVALFFHSVESPHSVALSLVVFHFLNEWPKVWTLAYTFCSYKRVNR